MQKIKCPMCGGEDFELVQIAASKYLVAWFRAAFLGFRMLKKLESYRCKKCEYVATFARS